ncbi:MAG: hypothetical protein U0264_01925 [Candidatus Kapaibacterium sp.]
MITLSNLKKQRKQIIPFIVVLVLYIYAIIVITDQLPLHIRKGPLPMMVMGTGLICIIFGYLKILHSHYSSKIEKLIQTAPLPEILAYYDTLPFNSDKPEQRFNASLARSLALCLYGEFDRGMQEIDTYDLSQFPPILKAAHLNTIVVHNYLQKKDLPLTLELSKQARNIALQYRDYPGIKMTHNTYIAFYTIGLLLNGDTSDTILQSLEVLFPKVYFVTRIQIAWALAIAYKKRGFDTKFQEMERYLRTNAPNCKPLHDFEL